MYQDNNFVSDRYWGCADSNWSNLHMRKNGCFDSQIFGWSGKVTTQCLCDSSLCNSNMTHLLRSYPTNSVLKRKLQSISRIQRRRRKPKHRSRQIERNNLKGFPLNDFSRTNTRIKSIYGNPEGRRAKGKTVSPSFGVEKETGTVVHIPTIICNVYCSEPFSDFYVS